MYVTRPPGITPLVGFSWDIHLEVGRYPIIGVHHLPLGARSVSSSGAEADRGSDGEGGRNGRAGGGSASKKGKMDAVVHFT